MNHKKTGKDLVVFFNSDTVGHGDESLGKKLMGSFVNNLMQIETRPTTLLFMNRGVFLVIEGSVVLEDLQELERSGARLLSCKTCLDYYQLSDKLRAGIISNMFDIVTTMTKAERVIQP